ncbi:hypothetical protein FQN57_003935 [Myotisia sp. PD_48]|nr:hypothetical protein FQN57_003935 [Myotisia sp. PD_48]
MGSQYLLGERHMKNGSMNELTPIHPTEEQGELEDGDYYIMQLPPSHRSSRRELAFGRRRWDLYLLHLFRLQSKKAQRGCIRCLPTWMSNWTRKRKCKNWVNVKGGLGFLVAVTLLFFLFSLIEAVFVPSYQTPPKHYQKLYHRIKSTNNPGRGNPKNEKVFIAANIVNKDLINGAWGNALLELVDVLGQDNVFVSIYENDSGQGTSDALTELKDKLPCNSSIVTGDHINPSDLDKVTLPNGEKRIQRLAYLAEVRNRALRPIDPSYINDNNVKKPFNFNPVPSSMMVDRVLFLNDVYFAAADAAQLLFSTNFDKATGRAKYRAACAIDFTASILFYDTFVVRDTAGGGMGFMVFPWFASSDQSSSRRDVLEGRDAVRVRSCWGGMAAFDANAFLQLPQAGYVDRNGSKESTTDTSISAPRQELRVRFRYHPEIFWEAAECCLLFADLEQILGNPAPDKGTGVFVNPYIRVAYTKRTWMGLDFFRRYERFFKNLQYFASKFYYPEYNPRQLHEPGQQVRERVWVNNPNPKLGGSFQLLERKASPGGFCGQRRLFVMENDIPAANKRGSGKNWQTIPLPNG